MILMPCCPASFCKRSKLSQRAVHSVNVLVVRYVVAEIHLRRRETRRNPDRVDSQRSQIIEFRRDAIQISDPVAIAIHKAAWINFVKDGTLIPGSLLHHVLVSLCSERKRRDPNNGNPDDGQHQHRDHQLVANECASSFAHTLPLRASAFNSVPGVYPDAVGVLNLLTVATFAVNHLIEPQRSRGAPATFFPELVVPSAAESRHPRP